jgi:hypothetical protein
MTTGTLFINNRDIETDFGIVVTGMNGFPGAMSMAPRDVPLVTGPEMPGGMLDPKLVRRQSLTSSSKTPAEIDGMIDVATIGAANALLDNLKNTLGDGEVQIITAYAPDRYCMAIVETFDGQPYQKDFLNGVVTIQMIFTVKDGLAFRLNPDGYALSTARAYCPIGTAPCKPVINLSTGGSATSVVNPVINILNAAGDVVQSIGLTGTIAQNDFWRIDCELAQISKSISGAALVDGGALLTSGDYLVLRPADAWYETASWASIQLTASSGAPVGDVTYTRAYR